MSDEEAEIRSLQAERKKTTDGVCTLCAFAPACFLENQLIDLYGN